MLWEKQKKTHLRRVFMFNSSNTDSYETKIKKSLIHVFLIVIITISMTVVVFNKTFEWMLSYCAMNIKPFLSVY